MILHMVFKYILLVFAVRINHTLSTEIEMGED